MGPPHPMSVPWLPLSQDMAPPALGLSALESHLTPLLDKSVLQGVLFWVREQEEEGEGGGGEKK